MRASTVEEFILEVLKAEHSHLTSGQIYADVRARLPAVNRSTVYRALERMAKTGAISVSDMGAGASVYEIVSGDLHHHLVCQNCGEVSTIGHQEVGDLFAAIKKKNGFEVATNHLVLFGICARCRSSKKAQMNADEH